MAKYQFVATHGVEFSEPSEDGRRVESWATFRRAPELDTPHGEKRYLFETDDASVARRLRKIDDYGITETSKVDDAEVVDETPLVVDLPAGNAGKAAWVDYAAAHGMTREEAEGRSVKELREHFANLRPVEQETPGQALVPPSQPRPNAQSDDEAAAVTGA